MIHHLIFFLLDMKFENFTICLHFILLSFMFAIFLRVIKDVVRTQFVTIQNDIEFARKKAQTISFVKRGFERLGLGHQTVVSRGVHTELNRVCSRSLSP